VAGDLLVQLDPEAWSRWAAESMAKLHPKLSASGTEHTITIEEPPADPVAAPAGLAR